MIRLSIPVRQALARLTLPVLIAAAFALMLLGKADAVLAERARMAVADALAPIYGVLATPLAHTRAWIDNARHMVGLFEDNARLREENERLRKWQAVAMTLDAENAQLKSNLRWVPEPTPSYVTARVVADAGEHAPQGRQRLACVMAEGWMTDQADAGDLNRLRNAALASGSHTRPVGIPGADVVALQITDQADPRRASHASLAIVNLGDTTETIAASSVLLRQSRMNDRSTFTESIGKRLRFDSEA